MVNEQREESGRVLVRIFDELPPSGAHGQIVSVREVGGLRRVQWDREAEEWRDVLDVGQIFDEAELPAAGITGQIVTVRDARGGLAQRQWDGEWKELAPMPLSVTKYRTLSVAAGDDTTDWQQLSAALASDIYIVAVNVRADAVAFIATDIPFVLQVAAGAVGSEDTLVDNLHGRPAYTVVSSQRPPLSERWGIVPPIKVDSGSRLVTRILNEDDAAYDWFTSGSAEVPQIIVHYYTDDDVA